METKTSQYIIKDVKKEAPDVTTLFLTDDDDSHPEFIPGQFITVFFPETTTPEGKSYSISSAPSSKYFSITIRVIGEFSRRLSKLQIGDSITASPPYGFFYSESKTSHLVLLAGGIGIAPFMSIIVHSQKVHPKRHISIFYSNKTLDMPFRQVLDAIHLRNISIQYFVTKERAADRTVRNTRMNAEYILTSLRNSTKQKEFMLCGSISFVRDLWRDLRERGVSEETIYTESFY